jgi:hypothetical protein
MVFPYAAEEDATGLVRKPSVIEFSHPMSRALLVAYLITGSNQPFSHV